MAIDKFVEGRTYKWDEYTTDYDQFVVTGVDDTLVYYTYPLWVLSEDRIFSEKLSQINFEDIVPLDGEEAPETDAVNHPSHYTSDPSGVECIQITRHRNFNIGNAIKYLWRAGLKEDASLDNLEKEIQDLEKAVFYIQDEIKRKREQ